MNEPISNKVIRRADLPLVVILLLTKDRTDYAIRTIHGIMRHLKYEGELKWFICDNGSQPKHLNKIREIIPPELRGPISVNMGTIGECWNSGIKFILGEFSHVYLRLEDDFVLHSDLDITKYIKIMMGYKEVGMVRLGQMVQDLGFFSEKFKVYTDIGWDEEILLGLVGDYNYIYSGNPALITKSFHDAHGYYSEDQHSPGEIEVIFDGKVRYGGLDNTPWIYFPWDMGRFGTWGAWHHIGKDKA